MTSVPGLKLDPAGPPVPPGMYTVRLNAIDPPRGQDFEVTVELSITLTP